MSHCKTTILIATVVLLLVLATLLSLPSLSEAKKPRSKSQSHHQHAHSHQDHKSKRSSSSSNSDSPCSSSLDIEDDPELDAAVERARQRFLATRPHPFDRLTSTLLVPKSSSSLSSTSWSRGSFDQNRLAYPASCVKMTYMVSAVQWCLSQKLKFNCLDHHVRPMIMVSSNLETGVVVDFVTGAPNLPHLDTANATFYQWLAKRNYTQEWMTKRQLLESQVVLHKTYPTNSGVLLGAEGLARNMFGGNLMNTKCTASLLAEIVSGKLFPEAREYFMELLYHPLDSYTCYGRGLPPGSIIYTKTGNAYDTVEEIAYVLLPNGKQFILSTFTNGYEPSEPKFDTLSYYIQLIIEEAKLDEGLPPKLEFDVSSSNFFSSGDWLNGQAKDMYGSSYKYNVQSGQQQAGWKFQVPEEGLYEISIWNPESSTASTSVPFTIEHASGTDTYNMNQRVNGGRWSKLDDLYFFAGQTYSVTLARRNSLASNDVPSVSVNALKVAKWPNCGAIPGSPCLSRARF